MPGAAAAVTGTVLPRTPFGVARVMAGSSAEATRYGAVDACRVRVVSTRRRA